MRFRGIDKLSVDAKGRLAVPKAHRDRLAEHGISELVITVDQSGCLLVYPEPVWDEVEQKLASLPNSAQRVRRMVRLTLGYATGVEIDGSGRVLLSNELRDYAGIEKKAVLIGQGKKFEIWNEEAWAAETARWKEDFNDMDSGDVPDVLQDLSI
ncbi:MAG: cell division/cell wall cluster transcriptional repressor MraZ [Gammaproteobacteria bacterium]|nr:MAG: cell division/cell wall cluster transcriptional repressor MraZ [Gammaproteobacteria bacterium]PIE35488.1 MAG: cell division/cell wall cluster transcriptional repressor MraZ [Gammaproteobacteria bacterium]